MLDAAAVTANESRPAPLPPASFVPFTPFEIPFAYRSTTSAITSMRLSPAPAGPTPGEARARLALEGTAPRPRDFTAAELRTAFRQLAREYHPDRHPHATGAEVLLYARTFASIAANYRRLATSLASRA